MKRKSKVLPPRDYRGKREEKIWMRLQDEYDFCEGEIERYRLVVEQSACAEKYKKEVEQAIDDGDANAARVYGALHQASAKIISNLLEKM